MPNKNLLIDTHAHTNFNDFKDDSREVIKRALDSGVWMINVGAERNTSERAVKMAEEYDEGVYAAVGLHPSHLIEQDVEFEENGERVKYKSKPEEFDYDYYLNLAKNKKVVGIGECGLDYYHSPQSEILNLKSKILPSQISPSAQSLADENEEFKNWKEKQKEIFIRHLELAREVKKPIIIHCREAHNDLLELLTANSSRLTANPGVMHFFGGPGAWENVQKYLEMGFYISLSGVVTFPNYSHAEDIRLLPLERILVETDCPYVAPVPYRGKRNEPAYVKYTAQKIADIRGLSFDEVAEQTTKNAKELFGI